jgi:hypothetical protein
VVDKLRSAYADFRAGISSSHQGLKPSPVRLRVVVKEDNVIPGATPQSLYIPSCETAVLRQRNEVREIPGQSQGAICRGVVHKDNLKIPEVLSLNSPETIPEDPLSVIIDNNNAYFRHGRSSLRRKAVE